MKNKDAMEAELLSLMKQQLSHSKSKLSLFDAKNELNRIDSDIKFLLDANIKISSKKRKLSTTIAFAYIFGVGLAINHSLLLTIGLMLLTPCVWLASFHFCDSFIINEDSNIDSLVCLEKEKIEVSEFIHLSNQYEKLNHEIASLA